ncbi:MAG: ester cyclase [Dehalococcoidia bacterium]|nr:ester cyclase [Dehalococcoidia bacterium]
MSEEDKTIVRRFLTETQNDKNLTIIDDLVADDFVGHTAEVKGPEQLMKVVGYTLDVFPALIVTFEDQIPEGDMVVTRYTAKGMQHGMYRGVLPTGEPVSYTVISIQRVVDGKIVEGWRVVDLLEIVHQIGAIF